MKDIHKELLERTFQTINCYLQNNYVMLRSFSDNHFSYRQPPIGERFPTHIFSTGFINYLKISIKPGLLFTHPNTPPTYGWYYPEWVDVIFSAYTSTNREDERNHPDINIKKLVDKIKDRELYQTRIIELNRREGVFKAREFMESLL